MEVDALQLAVAIAALIIGGLAKGVTGMGLPMIITPPLAWIFGIRAAVAIATFPAMLTNVFFIARYRRAWRDVIIIWPMVACGLVATLAGVIFLQHVDQAITAIILAVLAIGYALASVRGYEPAISERYSKLFGPLIGLAAGFFQGTTGVSAPMVAAYLASIKDFTREAYLQAVGLIFFIFGTQQVLGLIAGGAYTSDVALIGSLSMIPIMLSFYIGVLLQKRLDGDRFRLATLIIVLLAGLNLLFSNLQTLIGG